MNRAGDQDEGGATARDGSPRRLPQVRGFAEWPAEGSPKDEGKALRKRIPRSAHATFDLDASRPDAVRAVEESGRGRLPELTPIRVGRMAATPFAFLRGSAGLMACDLRGCPSPVRRPDLRRRPRGQLRPVRRRTTADDHGYERLRRDDRRPLGMGPEAAGRGLVLAGPEAGTDEEKAARRPRRARAYRRPMQPMAKLPFVDAWKAPRDEEPAPRGGRRTVRHFERVCVQGPHLTPAGAPPRRSPSRDRGRQLELPAGRPADPPPSLRTTKAAIWPGPRTAT